MYIIVSYDQVSDLPAAQHAARTIDGRVILPISVMKASNKSLTGVDFVTLETALSMTVEPESSDVIDSTTNETMTENKESINPENTDSNEQSK